MFLLYDRTAKLSTKMMRSKLLPKCHRLGPPAALPLGALIVLTGRTELEPLCSKGLYLVVHSSSTTMIAANTVFTAQRSVGHSDRYQRRTSSQGSNGLGCCTVFSSMTMVGPTGIEPVCIAARDFKSLVSTYFTTVPFWPARRDSNP